MSRPASGAIEFEGDVEEPSSLGSKDPGTRRVMGSNGGGLGSRVELPAPAAITSRLVPLLDDNEFGAGHLAGEGDISRIGRRALLPISGEGF